jgi:GT2 family glycosyltransferase
VEVAVPHYGKAALLADCLKALHLTNPALPVAVFNDNELGIGFGPACNSLAFGSHADIVIFVNNDCFVHDGWLEPLIACFDQPDIGIAGGRLYYPDGRVQHAGVGVRYRKGLLEAYNRLEDDRPAGDVHAVTGALMAVRKTMFRELGGFNPAYRNGYEDVDLCFRAREAGWRVVYEPRSCGTHLESQSGEARWRHVQANIAQFQQDWFGKTTWQ